MTTAPTQPILTSRQRQIVRLIQAGVTSAKDIASALNPPVQPETVTILLGRIYYKLNFAGRGSKELLRQWAQDNPKELLEGNPR